METGTYFGQTTRQLASVAKHVYSLEPQKDLFEAAGERLAGLNNITLINKSSEEGFSDLVNSLSGDVNFWLDGHYSSGGTYKGATDTPIAMELNSIATAVPRLGAVSVLIDDVREFGRSSGYPSLDYLVDWARSLNLSWHIEHDIFVARSKSPKPSAT